MQGMTATTSEEPVAKPEPTTPSQEIVILAATTPDDHLAIQPTPPLSAQNTVTPALSNTEGEPTVPLSIETSHQELAVVNQPESSTATTTPISLKLVKMKVKLGERIQSTQEMLDCILTSTYSECT